MGRLISVVGIAGVGKTTLVQTLIHAGDFFVGWEQHAARPFQHGIAHGLAHYALVNQVDYLLYRADQELEIRAQPLPGLQDGGLELDYWLFTRHFHARGLLTNDEFALCGRLYRHLRLLTPPPDLLIYLSAPIEIAARRMQQRSRGLEVARPEDLQAMQLLLDEWLSQTNIPILEVDATADDTGYTQSLADIRLAAEGSPP